MTNLLGSSSVHLSGRFSVGLSYRSSGVENFALNGSLCAGARRRWWKSKPTERKASRFRFLSMFVDDCVPVGIN